jgi:hypothetical protein
MSIVRAAAGRLGRLGYNLAVLQSFGATNLARKCDIASTSVTRVPRKRGRVRPRGGNSTLTVTSARRQNDPAGVGGWEGWKGGTRGLWSGKCLCSLFEHEASSSLDVGVGVHVALLPLFVGGSLRRSQRRGRITVDSVIDVLHCSPSGVGERIFEMDSQEE